MSHMTQEAKKKSLVRFGGVMIVLVLIAIIVVIAYRMDGAIIPDVPNESTSFDEDVLVDLSTFSFSEDPYAFLEKLTPCESRVALSKKEGVCVGTQLHSYQTENGPKKIIWDIYLSVEDGIIKTIFVNNKKGSISISSAIPEEMVENGPIKIKAAGNVILWVHPEGDDLESFMVIPD